MNGFSYNTEYLLKSAYINKPWFVVSDVMIRSLNNKYLRLFEANELKMFTVQFVKCTRTHVHLSTHLLIQHTHTNSITTWMHRHPHLCESRYYWVFLCMKWKCLIRSYLSVHHHICKILLSLLMWLSVMLQLLRISKVREQHTSKKATHIQTQG